MSIYKEYLEGEARELAIQEATIENELNKLDTMYEMTVLQLEQMYRDAELKVLTESGTYDDLMFLYEQADAEVKPQQGNIFQKIIDGIMSILSSIGNAIKGIFSTGNADDDIEIPKETVETAKKSLGMFGNIKQGVERIKNKDYMGGLQILKAIALPTLAVGAVAGATIVTVKMKKGELEGLAKKLDEMKKYFTDAIAKIKSSISNLFNKNKSNESGDKSTDKPENEGIFKGIFDKLRGFASSIKKIIDNIFTSIKKSVGGNKAEGENGEAATDANATKKDKKNKKGKKEPGVIDKVVDKTMGVVKDVAEVKNTAENMVSDAKNTLTGDQFVSIKGKMGKVWKVDKDTAKVRLFDKKGNELPINGSVTLPKQVIDKVNSIKAGKQTNESALVEELNAILGDDYLVEATESTIDIYELEDVKLESNSIFGFDVSNDVYLQESDAFDDDLSDLVELFGNL